MLETGNDKKVIELMDEEANTSQKGVNSEEKEFSEDAFFATGHFSIHHQPTNQDEVFIGE